MLIDIEKRFDKLLVSCLYYQIVDGSVQVQEADDDQFCLSLEKVCFGKHKEFHKAYVVQTEGQD